MSESVLDASALLAYLQDEPGAELVASALSRGCQISTVNWAEVMTKADETGTPPDELTRALTERGILGQLLLVVPFDAAQARRVAKLRRSTRAQGLSLADRSCLALAIERGLPALTTDRVWKDLAVGAEIETLR